MTRGFKSFLLQPEIPLRSLALSHQPAQHTTTEINFLGHFLSHRLIPTSAASLPVAGNGLPSRGLAQVVGRGGLGAL